MQTDCRETLIDASVLLPGIRVIESASEKKPEYCRVTLK
jgi:hypothetical protein